MQTILAAYSCSAGADGPDLFAHWQQELQLRHRLRDAGEFQGLRIENRAQLDFLRRGLFYGPRREVFFALLLDNMSDPEVFTLVLEAPPQVVTPFLEYIGARIADHDLPAASLGFLINLFQDRYQPQYERLIQALDSQQCGYLLPRTGNRQLRRMLKDRLEACKPDTTNPSEIAPGDVRSINIWPTLHGDKIELLATAAALLQSLARAGGSPGWSELESEALLDGAELLFRAGLLPDCMALLNRMLLDQELEKHLAAVAGTSPLQGRVQRLLDRVVPLYGLISAPLHPRGQVLDYYRNLFPGFSPDPISLLYLDLYAIVQSALPGNRQYARFEIIQKASKILDLDRADQLAAGLTEWNKNGVLDWSALTEVLATKMLQRPYQALAGVEVLRYLQLQGAMSIDKSTATRALTVYLQFFYWLPHPIFMNSLLAKQLGIHADQASREQAEQILAAQQKFREGHPTQTPGPQPAGSGGAQPPLDQMIRLGSSIGVV